MSTNNKLVLVIGSTSDIARATVKEFAQNGYSFILAARNPEQAERDAKDIAIRFSVECFVKELDVAKLETHTAFVDSLSALPEIVICVAGYLGNQELAQADTIEAEKILVTNFNGCISILSPLAERMKQRGSGCIIGISSVAGDRGRASNFYYGSAKAGFTAYLSGLRQYLGQFGVSVLTVKPGFVATKMTKGLPLPKPLTALPEEVAKDMFRAYTKGTSVLYTRWFWRYIMLIVKLVPEFIFKKVKM